MISLIDFLAAASRCHNDVILTSFSVFLSSVRRVTHKLRKIMGFSDEDKILIKNLHHKGSGVMVPKN